MKLGTILPWIAAAVVMAAIIAGAAVWYLKPAPQAEPRHVTHLYYELPKDQQFFLPYDTILAVSPDGTQFVYSTPGGLYLRSLDELDARLIPGTAGNPQRPFFSPDAKWVGYWSGAENQLKKIAVTGGAPVALASIPSSEGSFSWGGDDTIVFGALGAGITRISANGGKPEVILKEEKERFIHPQILPGGESVLFTNITSQPATIVMQSLKSGQRKILFPGDTAGYLPTGHLVYAVGSNLFAVPFDPDRLEVTGGPVPMVEGVFRRGGCFPIRRLRLGNVGLYSGNNAGSGVSSSAHSRVGGSDRQGGTARGSAECIRFPENISRWNASGFDCQSRWKWGYLDLGRASKNPHAFDL
jgi:hypothetical protein